MTDPAAPSRQDVRLAAVPAVYKRNDERLAVELVLKLDDPSAIFARYGYTADQALALLQDKLFGEMLERVSQEAKETGLSFRSKARAIAEDLLVHGYAIATDELAPMSVRAELIQWFTKVADLEPVRAKDGDKGAGGGLTLNIQFAGAAPQAVLTGREPITIEG